MIIKMEYNYTFNRVIVLLLVCDFQEIPFYTAARTTALSHREPSSAGISPDSCAVLRTATKKHTLSYN